MTSDPQNAPPVQPESPPVSPAPPAPPRPSRWRWLQGQRENLQILAIALVLAVVIRIFIAEPRYIPSDSMEPTLLVGDRLVVEKVTYRWQSPQTGDIVVFDPPAQFQEQFGFIPDKAFIKRIIGTPGDIVQVEAGAVYLNGQPLTEPYIAEAPNYQMAAVPVPKDNYFVMGDNRNNSNDSHVWGFLPRQNIIGRAVFRFFPFERLGRLNLSPTQAEITSSKPQVVEQLRGELAR